MSHRAFAAAMGLLTAAILAPGSQSQAASVDPTGYWMKPDAERESKIQVFKCGKTKSLLCAKIAWLKDPNDSKGRPLHDIRNEDPSARDRPIIGLMIFAGLAPSAPGTWTGQIYNPEDGHTYSATLTVISRKQILLRGCKAWLLCGEKQWLRTAAPEEPKPAAPAEGTQQIEASITPTKPVAKPPHAESVASAEPVAAAEAPSGALAPQGERQAMADSQASAASQSTEALPKPAALITPAFAVPAPPPVEYNARRGYGFLNVSANPDTRFSGENVSSMFVMTKPIVADVVVPISDEPAAQAAAADDARPVPLPHQKPKAVAKPIATASAKPAPKTTTPVKPSGQAAPAPQDVDAAPTDADGATVSEATTAEAAMVETVPLTRRQRRLLRKQQQQQEADPFLPWLR